MSQDLGHQLGEDEEIMKATIFKYLCAVTGIGLLSASLISSQSLTAAMAFEKKTGQDVRGKECERIDTAESSTFGKCENVCKDKEVTRDAPNNRWVCKAGKTAVRRPRVDSVPLTDKVKDSGAKSPSKNQPSAGPKTVKAKQK
jgi:hypothetical protein